MGKCYLMKKSRERCWPFEIKWKNDVKMHFWHIFLRDWEEEISCSKRERESVHEFVFNAACLLPFLTILMSKC